jgi:GTP-binding protein Era
MGKTAAAAAREADVMLLVVDAERPAAGGLAEDLLRGRPDGRPVLLVLNKVDRVRKPVLLPLMRRFHDAGGFAEIVPVSALHLDGTDLLLDLVRARLPEGPPWFTAGEAEAAPMAALVQEIVQERLFSNVHQEIPYGSAVLVDACALDGEMLRADATVLVDRDSHKGMVIGKGGSMIRIVGTEARLELERVLRRKVALKLNVKVEAGWRDREAVLTDLGYRQDPG